MNIKNQKGYWEQLLPLLVISAASGKTDMQKLDVKNNKPFEGLLTDFNLDKQFIFSLWF